MPQTLLMQNLKVKSSNDNKRYLLLSAGMCKNLIYFIFLCANAQATDLSTNKTPESASASTSTDMHAYDKKLIEHLDKYPTTYPSRFNTTHEIGPMNTVKANSGALLPTNRIVAYYGNFYSKRMGILGEHPPEQVLSMLNSEVAKWEAADPHRPVVPAINYITVVAQGSPGKDGKYRDRMPESQIQKAIDLANQVKGLAILDIQVGLSNLQTEIPRLAPYLALPNVMLAIDPEFSMKTGAKPGSIIGTMDATDINYAANYLASIVREYNLPPKILIVHRFTQHMVTNHKEIKPLPEVQIVMDMDGWGSQPKKRNTYNDFIAAEPVQYTGFKLFYVNDRKPPSAGLFTPEQILKLTPQPMFILYQ